MKNKISSYTMLRPIVKMTRLAKKKIEEYYDIKVYPTTADYLKDSYNEYVTKHNARLKDIRRVKKNAEAKQKRVYNIEFYVTIRRKGGSEFEAKTLTQTITATSRNKKKAIKEAKEAYEADILNRYGNGIEEFNLDSINYRELVDVTPAKEDRKQPMKDIVSLDGFGDQEWNMNNGTCVTDYLRWKYTDTTGFVNKNGKYWLSDDAFHTINQMIYLNDDIIKNVFTKQSLNNEEYKEFMAYVETKRLVASTHTPLITMEHLYLWCIIQNIPHYALDTNQHLVTDLKYVRNKDTKKGKGIEPVVYQMKNNHFNPVLDAEAVLSISQWGNGTKSISSDNIEKTNKKSVEYDSKEVVDLLNELPAIITEHDRDLQNKNIKIKETIKGCIEVSSIYIKEKKLKYFNLNTEELAYKNYCQEHKLDYKHQSLSTLGLTMIGDIKKSHMNPLVFKAFTTNGISHRIHHGQTNEFCMDKLKDAKAYDINKHYSAVLLTLGKVGIIQFQDDFKIYDNTDISIGYYFVETRDMTLLHGSNIYSHRIVTLALEEGIIDKTNIKLMLKCSVSIPAHRFKQFVEDAYNVYGNDLGKNIVNRSVGCLNNTSVQSYIGVGLTNSTDELMSRLDLNKKSFVKDMVVDGKTYWLYGSRQSTMCPSNNRPLWQSILDESNIILYNTAKKIGGTVLFRKTDCLVIHEAKNIKPSKEIGGYKVETIPKNLDLVESIRHIKLDRVKKVNILPYHTSDHLPKIIKHCKKSGLLIAGRGGTGKTYCALSLIEEFEIKVKLAFTNKATININGSTIDSYLKLNKDGKICSHWAYKLRAKYVIVDEISMLSSRYWSLLCDLKEMTGAIFILLGDYRQCQPIEADQDKGILPLKPDIKTKYEFNYLSAINYLTDYNRVNFNVFNPKARYDEDLWNVSEKVFMDDLTETKELEIAFNECDLINSTNICYLNTTRKSINAIVNEKMKPSGSRFLKCDDDYGQDAYIYEGLKVILSKTIKIKDKKIFSKNETSTLTKVDDNEITIGDKHTIKINEFHKFCLLGYATTIHKSQGDTCNGTVNVFNWRHQYMNGNLRYTAITRATKLSNIKIIHGFNDTYKESYGCVYKGVCSKTGKCYVGSTRNFEAREKAHISENNDCSSRHLIDPSYHIVAEFPSISKKQLLKMEQRYMDSVECINCQKASV